MFFIKPARVTPQEEEEGLDISLQGENYYSYTEEVNDAFGMRA